MHENTEMENVFYSTAITLMLCLYLYCFYFSVSGESVEEHIVCKRCGEIWCNTNDLFSVTSELNLHQRNVTFQVWTSLENHAAYNQATQYSRAQTDSEIKADSGSRANNTSRTVLIQLFVNPAGVSFELLASKTASARARTHGSPIMTDSWFPGYSWQPVTCKCGEHIGWKFTVNKDITTTDSRDSLSFYGLILSKVHSDKNDNVFLVGNAGNMPAGY